jgi:hypothetical protein
MSDPERLDGPYEQYQAEVDAYQHFNGATCLVIVDVFSFGSAYALQEIQAGRQAPSDDVLGDALEQEIRRKIAACPAGSNAKVQLLYHEDSKPIQTGQGKTRQWQIQNSIRRALRKFQQNNEPRFKKLFLCGCESQKDLDLVDAAFHVPSIEHVVTFDEIIFLPPGKVSGANTNFQEKPLHINVWHKDPQGRQIVERPSSPIKGDEELDFDTLYVEKKSAASTTRCPTQHSRTGSNYERVGTYESRDSAANAIITLSGSVPPYPQSFAMRDAVQDMEGFACPNASCTKKSLSTVTVTNYEWEISTTLGRFFLSVFGVRRWILYVKYDWSSRITCN